MGAMTAAPGISSETFAQRRAFENQQDRTSSLGNIPGQLLWLFGAGFEL